MDDNAKNACSYQVDQDLLDERGINMTVEEVAGLSTCKYSERVQSLKLCNEDLAFLKGLRRRIKNRLASQNSRRRSVEHLRRLTRELRAVRACRRLALTERRALVLRRDQVRDKCVTLRRHLLHILQERSDATEVPSIDVESQPKEITKVSEPNSPANHISVIVKNNIDKEKLREELEREDDIYERVRKELQKEIQVKETVIIDENAVRDTLIIKEEPEYEEITIDDEFDHHRRSYDLNHINYDLNDRTICNNLNGRRSCDDFSQSCHDDNERSSDVNDRNCDDYSQRSSDVNKRSSDVNERSYDDTNQRSSDVSKRSSDVNKRNCDDYSQRKNYESSDDFDMKNVLTRSESSDRDIFECKIGKLVTQSVNHMFNDKKKIFAKTVFISNNKLSSNIKTVVLKEGEENGVLNLSIKEGRRRSHGRKQSAPKRIAYCSDYDDGVLDLKMKKEHQ